MSGQGQHRSLLSELQRGRRVILPTTATTSTEVTPGMAVELRRPIPSTRVPLPPGAAARAGGHPRAPPVAADPCAAPARGILPRFQLHGWVRVQGGRGGKKI